MTSKRYSAATWFLLAIALLITVGTVVMVSFTRFDAQKRWVAHTYQVIVALENVVSNLKDVQSAQRGYVITGLGDYLTPYSVALPRIAADFTALETMVADNPEQQERLRVLKDEAGRHIELATQIITAHDEKGREAAFALIREGRGKKGMDHIRALAAEMVAAEETLLRLRQLRAMDAAGMTRMLGGSGFAVALGILWFVFWNAESERRRRRRAEDVLQRALEDLRAASAEDRAISQMTEYLQGCSQPQEAFDLLRNSMPHLLPGTSGAIYMLAPSKNQMELAALWGARTGDEIFDPKLCWAMRRGHMHASAPDSPEPACGHIDAASADRHNACYPLMANGETLGVFYLRNDSTAPFTEMQENAGRRIADQAALTLANLGLQDLLRSQSVRDPLTRLFNRRYLEEALEKELSRAERGGQALSVLVLDIDHFKKYNDTRGHAAGDALLTQFAKLLHGSIRKEDIACRYGGEEFVIVLPTASADMAAARAEQICRATRDLRVQLGHEDLGPVTVSIGVATYPQHGERINTLIDAADQALYRAKNEGRDRVKLAAAA